MKGAQDDSTLFDAYLDGSLKDAEKRVFETRLQEDEALNDAFNTYKEAVQLIKNEGFRREVKEMMATQKSPRRLAAALPWIGGIAASVVLVIAAWVLWPSADTPEALFVAYYEPYPYVFTARKADADEAKYQGSEAYKAENYHEAITFFEASHRSDTVQFYLSMSYVETGKWEKAIATLQEIEDGSVFSPQRNWYLGLMYLKTGQARQARSSLIKIGKEGFQFEKAQAILDKLD